MEPQIQCPPVSSVEGEGLRKGTMTSAITFVWQRATTAPPSSFPNARQFSSSAMSLVPFKLLSQCWSSEGVSLSKFLCGPFKRNCLGLQKPFISFIHNPQWFLQPEVMGTCLPSTGALVWWGVGSWCEAGTPCSSGRTPAAKIPLPILNCHV